jgi:hypothetical protein
MPLHFLSSDLVQMDQGTYMWVLLTHFAIEAAQEDGSLLAALIESRGYAHDYASPFKLRDPVEPAVHGRWWRDKITPALFTLWPAAEAQSLLRAWANDQDADEPMTPSPEVELRLQDLYTLLESGQLYKLNNPGTEAEHDYGWVTGKGGFHEFVVIDRAKDEAIVLVAYDD